MGAVREAGGPQTARIQEEDVCNRSSPLFLTVAWEQVNKGRNVGVATVYVRDGAMHAPV